MDDGQNLEGTWIEMPLQPALDVGALRGYLVKQVRLLEFASPVNGC